MFSRSSTLLSLDQSPIKEILVNFCAEGKRGYQTLLNLRLVCKTTKAWVENLPPAISRRVFQDVILHVEVTRQNLSHYLESPFSSIRIPNLFFELREDSFDMDLAGNVKDAELFVGFHSFWRPRLESLELVHCRYPASADDETTAPNLRSFQCHCLTADEDADDASLFENFPFGIERISITHFKLSPSQQKEFYRRLITNSANLKYFATAPFYSTRDMLNPSEPEQYPAGLPGTLQSLRQLVESKKSDPDFTLVLNFKGCPRYIIREEDDIQIFLEWARSLLDSVSDIQLHSFSEDYFVEVFDSGAIADKDEAQSFCKRIYSFSYIVRYPELLTDYFRFPNLNQIGITISVDFPPEWQIPNADLRHLPNLTRLGFYDKQTEPSRWPEVLAPTLTQLRICNWESSIMDLVKGLHAVSGCSPILKTLILNYEVISNEIPPLEDMQVSLQKTRIQSVTFRVKCSDEIAPYLAGVVAKAVTNLPLRKLYMEFYAPRTKGNEYITPPVVAVDESILKILRTPPILENILHFHIKEECVETGAIPLLEEMKSYADGNKIRLRSSPQVMDNPKRTKRVFSLEQDVEPFC